MALTAHAGDENKQRRIEARMVRCFRKTGPHLGESNNEQFLNKIDTWFNKSYQTVKDHAKLTYNGTRIFNSFKPYAYE